jgi:N,N'-diacetyllegionaminate synthase
VDLRGASGTGGDVEKLNIGGRTVGPGHPPYIIAEIGANHNGDMDLCRRLIDAAKAACADAVKFQSWSKHSITGTAELARNTSYSDKKRHFGSLEEMIEKYLFTPEQHHEIAGYCRGLGITFCSSCFATQEVDLLVDVGAPVLKVASMDVNYLPLLEYVAHTGLPVILSTGMSTLGEIESALAMLRDNGSGPVALMHCISIYPPEYNTINLHNIQTLQTAFDVPVGFSDHSLGTAIPLAAIALGACIIEKHFTLDKTMDGWDHAISADPAELEVIAREGHNIFEALGTTVRTVSPAEIEKAKKFRRSVVVNRALQSGHTLSIGDLGFKRPGTGIRPDEARYVVGRRLKRAVQPDHELAWTDLG